MTSKINPLVCEVALHKQQNFRSFFFSKSRRFEFKGTSFPNAKLAKDDLRVLGLGSDIENFGITDL